MNHPFDRRHRVPWRDRSACDLSRLARVREADATGIRVSAALRAMTRCLPIRVGGGLRRTATTLSSNQSHVVGHEASCDGDHGLVHLMKGTNRAGKVSAVMRFAASPERSFQRDLVAPACDCINDNEVVRGPGPHASSIVPPRYFEAAPGRRHAQRGDQKRHTWGRSTA